MVICLLCKLDMEDDEFIILKCYHTFCWKCIEKHIKNNMKPKINCAVCSERIPDNKLRQIMSPETTTQYEMVCLGLINKLPNKKIPFKCLIDNCNHKFYCDGLVMFDCEVCTAFNCMFCKATHKGLSCAAYREDINHGQMVCKDEIDRVNIILKNRRYLENQEKIARIVEKECWENINCEICGICNKSVGKGMGITLKFSGVFCRNCLAEYIKNESKIPISNPTNSNFLITEEEIKSILNENQLEVYLKKCLDICKISIRPNKFITCSNPECSVVCHFIVSYDKPNTSQIFACFKCKSFKCLKCFQCHRDNKTCLEYAESIRSTIEGKDLYFLENDIKNKILMRCPNCSAILRKLQGCDWVVCPTCNTEICWVTQNFRWGPNGNGDISGGCRCQVDGKPCHPDCTWSCH